MTPAVVLIAALALVADAAIVTWIADAGLERAQNYAELAAPCGRSRVLLPRAAAVLRLPPDAAEIVLPRDAELRLAPAGLTLGPAARESCPARTLHYRAGAAAWADPTAWSSMAHNAATPDAERPPCSWDVAAFPASASGVVLLPDDERTVAEVRVGGRAISPEELEARAQTGAGSLRFAAGATGRAGLRSGGRCRSPGGCPCQPGRAAPACPGACPVPACASPVTPLGNCCAVCGAVLRFARSPAFVMVGFRRLAARAVRAASPRLEHHVGVLAPDLVQLVVVERGTFSDAAALVVDRVRRELEPGWAREVWTAAAAAGGAAAGWEAAGGALLAVLAAGAALFVRNYPPRWAVRAVRAARAARGGVWARGRSDSVLTLARRDSGSATAAFRNPLYDSRRDRVRIVEDR